jgi:hypothetical protein
MGSRSRIILTIVLLISVRIEDTRMTWSDEEFAGVDFGDRRRTRRFLRIVAAWWARLGPSVASNCQGWAEQMASYRLFACARVTRAAVLAPHRRMTLARAATAPVVLLVQDTTELVYAGKPIARTPGEVGPLNTLRRVGLQAHLQYALTPDRRPLGVLGMRLWARTALQDKARTRAHKQQPLTDKESYRWVQGYRTACALQRRVPTTQVVSLADREGDIYEVLVAAQRRPAGAAYVIRACQDRAVVLGRGAGRRTQSLRLLLRVSPAVGAATLTVPAGPGRSARTARVTLHAQAVTFRPPARTTGALPPVTVHAVLVREVDPPSGEAPLEWVLLTGLPIATAPAVQRIVQYYACRWEIEVFFRLWKSGCQVEALQWHTRERLAPCLALCAVLAWRVHLLGRVEQTQPDAPCTMVFSDVEWRVIAVLVDMSPPARPPSVRTVLRWLAQIGGFAGRRADGPPGPLVLMRGWLRVQEAIRYQQRLDRQGARCV